MSVRSSCRRDPAAPTALRVRDGLVLAAMLSLAACAAVGTRPLPPRVEVEGVRLAAAPSGDPVVDVRLGVDNPNAFPVSIRSIDATIRIEDVAIAVASLPAPVTLVASGRTMLDVEARPDIAALRQVVERLLRTLRAGYEVAGSAVIQDGMRLDFRRRGDLPIADLLRRLR